MGTELLLLTDYLTNRIQYVVFNKHCSDISDIVIGKGVFKGGVQGVQTPPEIFRFFLKSEGKEIERKRKKKGCWGGGVTS